MAAFQIRAINNSIFHWGCPHSDVDFACGRTSLCISTCSQILDVKAIGLSCRDELPACIIVLDSHCQDVCAVVLNKEIVVVAVAYVVGFPRLNRKRGRLVQPLLYHINLGIHRELVVTCIPGRENVVLRVSKCLLSSLHLG